ncbi:MAG TPA: glycosyltransferase [Acidiferrobacteraceae bacterium]|nr:glycosyltransferase [Acidiferrobacteraceae bacterium]
MIAKLADGMVQKGFEVDLLLIKAEGNHVAAISSNVNVIRLGCKHSLSAIPKLIRYLRKRKPCALLAAKHRAIRSAVLAQILSGQKTIVVGNIGTTVSGALKGRSAFREWIWKLDTRLFYRYAYKVIGVSYGVQKDIQYFSKLPLDKIPVVRYPVIDSGLFEKAHEPVDHPWFDDQDIPVLLGSGRFTRQKDFPTLLHAFKLVLKDRSCRLVILGEGSDRPQLESLVEDLGIKSYVWLPGFVANPYPFVAKASAFVLSSRWEGSPIVLTEALALGTPAVSTDCPSGPMETLAGGKHGPLVPMNNPKALAAAILQTLDHPLPPEQLKNAVREYNVETSARRHLEIMRCLPDSDSSEA